MLSSMAKGSKTSSLNLSLLSRGIGQVRRNGHERIDVLLEPQDYFNFIGGGVAGWRRVGHLPALASSKSAPALTLLGSERSSGPSTTIVHKTFTTRKGALLLFSEDLAQRMRSKTKKRMRRKALHGGKSTEDGEDNSTPDLETLEDLTNAILTYGNRESGINLRFIKSQRSPRPIRPGFSAKRYLSRLTRAFDEGFLETLLDKGFVSEKTLFTSNSLLPHLRRRIDDDLSQAPAPYRILRQMLTGPGLFTGFSFFRDGSEGTFLPDQLGKCEKDGEVLQVVQTKNGVQTPVNYERLSQEEKKNALADILVKSAIGQVLEIHRQNITFPAVKEDPDEDSESSGRGSSLKTLNRVNMMEAVRTYLRGSQTDRHSLPNGTYRPSQLPSDQQTASDDLYVSDRSTIEGDSISYASSRRSSIGLPVATSGPRGQNQNKMTGHPMRLMTPIIDSRMASREVTLNAIPLLPPITITTTAQQGDRDPLPKSDDKIFEKMLKDEERKLTQMLSGVLRVGGFVRTGDAEEMKRTSGPSSVRSFGSFKGGGYTQRQQKKNLLQMKPGSLKGVGGPTDGSVVIMPGGEVIQVGHSITIADNYQKKRPTFDGRGSFPSDALLIQKLAEGARNLASLVLNSPETGQDLNNDALRAAELWMATQLEMPEVQGRLEDVPVQRAITSADSSLLFATAADNEASDQSVAEYRDMLTGTLLDVVSRLSGRDFSASPKEVCSISPELMQSLLTRTVDPKEITVVNDATGRSVITVMSGTRGDKKKTDVQSSARPSNDEMEPTFNGFTAADVNSRARKKENQQTELSSNKTDEEKSRETAGKGEGKTATSGSERLRPLVGLRDAKKSKVDGKNSKETMTEGGTLKMKEFVVGKVDDKMELEKLYRKPEAIADSKKSVTNRKKKKRKKGEAECEATAEQSGVSPDPTKKDDKREDPSVTAKSKKKTKEPVSMEDASEDVDFVFASETWSDDEPIPSPQQIMSRISNTTAGGGIARSTKSPPQTDDDANQPSYFSDTSASSKNESNKLNRAAQREAKAEQKRQEVQRKRRERAEQLRREKEEAERMEQMLRELEEERLRREEAKRLEKERLEELKRRREEERLSRERRAELEAERERRMKEEYMRKLEEMKRKQEEEAKLRAELEEKLRLEEAERQRAEQLMLAKMEAEEREQYLRMKMEEEEKLRRLEEEDRRRRLEEQQRAAEEAMRLAQEIARRQAELQRRLAFNRSLHSESGNLSQSQSVTRAFVFSYLELLTWLSLDHPNDNALPNYADVQKSE